MDNRSQNRSAFIDGVLSTMDVSGAVGSRRYRRLLKRIVVSEQEAVVGDLAAALGDLRAAKELVLAEAPDVLDLLDESTSEEQAEAEAG